MLKPTCEGTQGMGTANTQPDGKGARPPSVLFQCQGLLRASTRMS